jgi:hypothetical protein
MREVDAIISVRTGVVGYGGVVRATEFDVAHIVVEYAVVV